MSRAKSKRVVIVGAGLFGSMAAKLCAENGFQVTVIDAKYKEAGSAPAACLIAPSWIVGLGKKADIGMKVLHKLYAVKSIQFRMNKMLTIEANWINPRTILKLSSVEIVKDEVIEVYENGIACTANKCYTGEVLIAAGVWCDQLVDMPPIQQLTGAALLYNGVVEPEINVWAPYKQAVQFNISSSKVWFGDGTSILRKNFGEHRIEDSIKRASKYLSKYKLKGPNKVIVGRRPYIKGEKGYFKKLGAAVYVSTGGAKNGTVLAAYQAQQFLEAIS